MQQNSAFVEFVTVTSFNAAVAANPHKIADENVYVEERRPTVGGYGQRGSLRGRGGAGFDSRQGQPRGGFSGTKDGAPRGGPGFPRGSGRGGAGNAGRGRPQAV